MNILYHVIIVLEMVSVNLLTLHLCSKSRYSNRKIILVLAVFTILIVGFFMPFLKYANPHYGNGNGLFVLVGFLYLFPLRYLYKLPNAKLLMIVCSAWIYTMLIFMISLHTSLLLFPHEFALSTMGAQTGLYVLTGPLFMKFIRYKFMLVLENVTGNAGTSKWLQWVSVVWFITLVLVNYTLVTGSKSVGLLCMLLLAVNVISTYSLLYSVVNTTMHIEMLKKTVYRDSLTGLPNRNSLLYECEKRIQNGIPFDLIFFDLDYFKSVNDRFGHVVGDEYLKKFSKVCKSRLKGMEGVLFRISGDEFICLCSGGPEHVQRIQGEMKRLKGDPFLKEINFLGVSCGSANYPSDAACVDKLISIADQAMYRDKSEKHRK
ncbi:GGDEF domain-containing protein [Bacillus sp. 1P06AnD]|uniref:GGDEF domain-containing protein n=1 Tax=Bacillus sp. 1P06AnD TaxID=3132208 RepID=UPI0039A2A176